MRRMDGGRGVVAYELAPHLRVMWFRRGLVWKVYRRGSVVYAEIGRVCIALGRFGG